ncbi:MAG: hypothetical protein OEY29_00395 [Gammaproteobacteria bacterium]|nr:hypothetical protein [Gammaproteobacteria bacterium]
MSEHDDSFEELVLKESIVSAAGLNSGHLQIGIRGDPSLRETTYERKRYDSPADKVIDALQHNLLDLMLNRSTYRIYVGFNSGEIRTHSVFDPLRQEIHTAEKMADPEYIKRQFPAVSYEDKIQQMRELYAALRAGNIYKKLPAYWQSILNKRSATWQPMKASEIDPIISTFKVLRDMQQYYLRNVTLCIVQSLVSMQFNCDGTQIISAENYKNFLEANLP